MSMALVEGESDSGKSARTRQLVCGFLHDGLTVIVFTMENIVNGFIRKMNNLSLDVTDFLLLRRLKVFDI